jgi:hypothetical protein
MEQSLTESGGDQPFVQVLDRYEEASDEERERLFCRFPVRLDGPGLTSVQKVLDKKFTA